MACAITLDLACGSANSRQDATNLLGVAMASRLASLAGNHPLASPATSSDLDRLAVAYSLSSNISARFRLAHSKANWPLALAAAGGHAGGLDGL